MFACSETRLTRYWFGWPTTHLLDKWFQNILDGYQMDVEIGQNALLHFSIISTHSAQKHLNFNSSTNYKNHMKCFFPVEIQTVFHLEWFSHGKRKIWTVFIEILFIIFLFSLSKSVALVNEHGDGQQSHFHFIFIYFPIGIWKMHDTTQFDSTNTVPKQLEQGSQPLWLFNGDERSSSAKTNVTLVMVAQLFYCIIRVKTRILSDRYIIQIES